MSSGELPGISPRERAKMRVSVGSRGVGSGGLTLDTNALTVRAGDLAGGLDDGLALEPADSLTMSAPASGPVMARRPPEPAAARGPALPSSVIHELRTPLTSIHGYAQILQRMLKNEPRASNALEVVVRESARLTAMLAQLSELAELDAAEQAPALAEIDVRRVVEDAAAEVQRRDGTDHTIAVHGKARIRSDARRLRQALHHILLNAVRYSAAGSPVEVEIHDDECRVEIVVRDEGIGIEADDAERVYDRFERGSNARKNGVRGLGLGLYLARAALDQVGGTVSHEPSLGQGTVFRVCLPRGR